MQPDSIIPNPSNPQTFNRYSYVLNRSVNFNDPTGHDIQCPIDGDCYETCEVDCTYRPPTDRSNDNGDRSDPTDYNPDEFLPNHSEDSPEGLSDQTVLIGDLETLDLLFNPWVGPAWQSYQQNPEIFYDYRRRLRMFMFDGLYGVDSYAALRVRVALALPLDARTPGIGNSLPNNNLDNFMESILIRIGWEPYDRFLSNIGLDTGHGHPANYEPYFLEGLMNTEYGEIALGQAKAEYMLQRNLVSDADVLEYLMNTCSGCGE